MKSTRYEKALIFAGKIRAQETDRRKFSKRSNVYCLPEAAAIRSVDHATPTACRSKMMRRGFGLGAFALLATLSGTMCAEDCGFPQGGRYEVAVTLKLPHLDDVVARKMAIICVCQNDPAPYGLKVMSDNNSLANCPPTNSRLNGKTLTFDIVCDGPYAARAAATYAFDRQAFEGQIEMKMGGKNMTMTETQSGRRIGDCSASGATQP